MIQLTDSNYYSKEANKDYWSVSQFKAFCDCEASALASVRGEYERELTDSLLFGSFVDAYFTDDRERFIREYGDLLYTRKGELYAKYQHAYDCIDAVEAQPLMMGFLRGEYQQIFTGELFDVPWKIKVDVMNSFGIVDLKTVKDFEPVYKEGLGRVSFIEAWGYDIQGAVYQRIVEQATGERKPFYIVAVTKEKVPDVAVIQIPQHILDTALKLVESKIDRFDLIKSGDIEPRRCERCDYCKRTKRLTEPEIFEIEEA